MAKRVVVYGGTAAGVAAALAAARSGSETVLIERGDHIGGMVASGLGLIDSLRNSAFGGIVYEFLTRVRAHYADTDGPDSPPYRLTYDGLLMEPRIAERALDEMVQAQPRLTVLKRHQLVSAEKDESRLVASTYKNRDTGEDVRYEHAVAIDGTYEGDLAAAAGAAFRVHREGRKEFGERFAGEIFFDPRYYKQEIHPSSTGEASPYIQANCFRVNLSDADDRVPITKPGAYSDLCAHYRMLLQDFDRGRIRHLNEILWLNPMVNRKYLLNGHIEALTSANVAELSVEWAEGDWETRDRLFDYYRSYTLGLLYFLQNDPQMPLVPKSDVNRFGLPADEYPNEGHFPWQLYVRVGRRLIGEYQISEHDAVPPEGRERPAIHRDTIAIFEHGFDAHPCRDRRKPGSMIITDDGFELLEGVIYFKSKYKAINKPSSIPYRAIVPEKVDGLLVPVALSATSVAFSSIRMEPVWMAAAEAAGRAASQAINDNVEVRKVDVRRLQNNLLDAGQVLVYFPQLDFKHPDFKAIQLQAVEQDHPDFDLKSLGVEA